MPKIPTFSAPGDLAVSRGQPADPSAFAAPYAAVAQAGAQTQALGVDMLRVQRVLANEQMTLDIDEKLAELKVLAAEDDARLQAAGLPGKDFAVTSRQQFQTRRQGLEGQLLYPESVGTFRRRARALEATHAVNAIGTGVKLQHGEILGVADVQQREDINTAVFAEDPAERQRALERSLDRPLGLMRQGVISGPAYTEMQASTLRRLEEGGIERDAANPALTTRVLDLLETGKYRHLTPEEQLKKADSIRRDLVKRADDEAKRLEKEAESDRQGYLADLETRIDQAKAGGGDLGTLRQEVYRAAERRVLKRPDVTHALALIDSTREAPSDPGVLLRVSPDVHGTAPTFSEANIRALMVAHAQGLPGLSLKDGTALIDRRRIDSQRKEDKDLAMAKDEYGRAYAEGRLALGFTSALDFGSSEQQKRLLYNWTVAFNAANRRTNPASTQGPWEALRETLPRYQSVQTNDAKLSMTDNAKAADTRYRPFPMPDPGDEKAFQAWADRTAKHLDAMPEKATDPRTWRNQTNEFQRLIKQWQDFLTTRSRQQTTAEGWKGGTQRKPGQASAGPVNE